MTGNREPAILPQPFHLRNRRCRVEMFQSRRRLFLSGNVTTAITFRTRSFFGISSRHPGPQKSGLAGKDIANLRVAELTKGLDDFSLCCLSNGEFQSLVFVKQLLLRTCFATSGRIVLIWMLWQPICMARLLLTSIKSRRGSCNFAWRSCFNNQVSCPCTCGVELPES